MTTSSTKKSPRWTNTEGTNEPTPTNKKRKNLMEQYVPHTATVNLDLFKTSDWMNAPEDVVDDLRAKKVDLRINTGAGEHVVVGLISTDSNPIPEADIPALVEMTPSDLRALASGLERVAAIIDDITEEVSR